MSSDDARAQRAFRDELKKANKSLGKSAALDPKTMIEMDRTSNGIKGVVDTLRGQLVRLEGKGNAHGTLLRWEDNNPGTLAHLPSRSGLGD